MFITFFPIVWDIFFSMRKKYMNARIEITEYVQKNAAELPEFRLINVSENDASFGAMLSSRLLKGNSPKKARIRMSMTKAAPLFHTRAGPVNMCSFGRLRFFIKFVNYRLYIKIWFLAKVCKPGICCLCRRVFLERYINAPELKSRNEQEEGGAGEAGADTAGDHKDHASERKAGIWHHRAAPWRLKDEGKVP